MIANATAPAAITPTRTQITISMTRRSPGVSGSVGGVLPRLAVGGSFVRRTRSTHNKEGRQEIPNYVPDAAAISAIDLSSIASNSAGLCWAVRPSVSAREKLAMTPWLRAKRAQASSRV
jgi:hypothetical protein